MPTIFSVGAYRIVVFANDHAPAHVNVLGPDGHAKFVLGLGAVDVALTEVDGIGKRDLRRIAAAIIDRFDECMATWEKMHGDKGRKP